MARSVSVPHNAAWVVYVNIPDVFDHYDFDMLIESLQESFSHRFSSLGKCDNWVGREDHVILENLYACIGVSEYNGIIAIWGLADSYYGELEGLAENWISQIENSARTLVREMFPNNVLTPMGTFSNGEQCFRISGQPQSCVTSKEGQLW